MGVGVSAGTLEDLSVVGVPSSGEVVYLGNTLEALRVLGNRVGNGLGVDEESLLVEVVDGVASLVVVDVVSNTSLTAKLLGLLLGLELLSAGEETTGGNTVLDESGVVRTAAELGGDRSETLGLEELLKVLLDGVGTSGAGQVESITITIIDTVDVVGAGNHVKVEVGTDLGDLGVGAVDALHVGVRSEETELFGTPETEADGVLDAVLGESLGDVEDTDDTGAVVVDTGASSDRVGVSSNDKNVVVVTLLGLSNDVEGNTVLDSGVDLEVNLDLAGLGLGKDSLTRLEADADNGGKVAKGLTKSTAQLASDVVVDNDGGSSGSLAVGGLGGESTLSSLNKDNLALGLGGEIAGLTSEVGGNDERTRSLTSGGVGHDSGSNVLAVGLEGGGTSRVQLSEGLLLDIVVVEGLEGVVEVVDGGVVTLASKDTGVVVGLCNVLELLGTGHKTLEGDVLLELELVDERLLGGRSTGEASQGKDGGVLHGEDGERVSRERVKKR